MSQEDLKAAAAKTLSDAELDNVSGGTTAPGAQGLGGYVTQQHKLAEAKATAQALAGLLQKASTPSR